MVPGDRLICAFTEPVAAGQEFGDWLLHVTVVPWFRVAVSTDVLLADLTAELQSIKAFPVELDEVAQFGHNRGKSANLVLQPAPFMEAERIVRQYLRGHDAWMVNETTKKRRPYVPHVTAQRDTRLQAGDRFMCDRLAVVRQLGGRKVVDAIINLLQS